MNNIIKKILIVLLKILISFVIFGIIIYMCIIFNSLAFLLLVIFLLIVSIAQWLGGTIGKSKAKRLIRKEEKNINKTNPYIYFRELPNDFGIGVTTLLLDSKIENYKDIVAVILDLCAKKYLHLIKQNDKYVIKVLKNIDDNLLTNEKYIMDLIINDNIKNIDYNLWFNYCLYDGSNFGLYHSTINKNNKIIKNDNSVKINILIIIIMDILYVCLTFNQLLQNDNLIYNIFYTIFLLIVIDFILVFILYIIKLAIMPIKMFITNKKGEYQKIMNNHLIRTKKGIDEVQKLYAFRSFINDFGHFVDKHAEEVVIWDRYLSYAQVFGLTKEIIKSGYKEIVDNGSFQIDNFDNINFSNIVVDKKA